MKKIFYFLLAMIFAIQGWTQGEITIGANGTGTARVPIDHYYNYSYSQMIYDQSSLTAGTISAIKFKYASTTATTANPVVVYMKTTTQSSFSSTTDFDSVGLVQVYSGSINAATGWVTITLTTPYVYDGTGNLLIAVDNNTADYDASYLYNNFSTTDNKTIYTYSDDYNVNPLSPNGTISTSTVSTAQFLPSLAVVITPTDPTFCFPPTNIVTSNIVVDGAQLTWDIDVNVSSYSVEYKTSLQTWAEATLIPGIVGNTYTFTNLNPSTLYNVRILPACSSSLPAEVSFRTACGNITTFPWTEGFETTPWSAAVTPGNALAPDCWLNINLGATSSYSTYAWVRTSTSSYIHSGTGAAQMYTGSNTNATNDWLITPPITLTGGERINFWAKGYYSAYTSYVGKIKVKIFDITTNSADISSISDTSLFTEIMPNTIVSPTDWNQYEINLSQFVGDFRIAFVVNTTGGYYINLDDVSISELPTCIRPSNLTVSNISTTGAEISWVNGSDSDASWWLYYKQGSATTFDSIQINSNPYTIQTFTPSSTYQIYLKTDCSTELSESSNLVSFQTLCEAIDGQTGLPWNEGFEGITANNQLPACWSATNLGTYTYTIMSNDSRNRIAKTGTKSAYFKWSCNDKFTTPVFNLYAGQSYDFSFWYITDGDPGWQSLKATVKSYSDSSLQNIGTPLANVNNTTYQLYLGTFTPSADGIYEFNIECISNSTPYYLTIDDISLTLTPDCPDVYGLAAQPASTSSVSVNWNDEGDEGDGYVIAYSSTSPFDPTTATSVVVPTGTPLPYIIPGFNPGDSVWVSVQRGCMGNWATAVQVNLPTFVNSIPFIADFEDSSLDSVWMLTNGSEINKWYIGVPGANDSDPSDGVDERGLYISSDNGLTNTYSNASECVSFASTLVEFGNFPAYELNFDWSNFGEIDWHDLNVYLLPIGQTLTPGILPDDQYRINSNSLAEQTNFQSFTLSMDGSFSNTVKQLVFAWENDTYGLNLPPARVDNISLVALTCGMPYDLTFDSASASGTDVYLHWDDPQGATSWIVEYQQAGTTTWNQAAAATNPFTLTGLIPGTSYQARVRSICNATDTSGISNVISFQTTCVDLTVPTVPEGFNLVPPSTCWERKSGLLPATGNASLSSYTGGWILNSNVTPSNAKINLYYTSCNYWLISPSIDLGDGTSPAQLEFDVFFTDYGNADVADTICPDDRFAVVVSTDNGLTWNSANAFIWSNDAAATRVLNNIPNTPMHVILPLNDPATSLPYTGTVKIGFYGESTVSNADNDLHIDNFEVIPFATCQRTTSLAANNLTSTSADISFQENGTATTWQYILTTDTTITNTNNGTPVTSTTNPIQLTGLTPLTDYTIWVRADCGTVDGTSVWSTPLTFATEAIPANVPYYIDFEDLTEGALWKNVGATFNKWAIGTAAGNGPTTSGTTDSLAAYISYDNGLTWGYSGTSIYAYFYRDIDFGPTPTSYRVTYDWKVGGYIQGTSVSSGLLVYLRDPNEPINPSGFPTDINNYIGLNHSGPTWQHGERQMDTVSGVQRLIFMYFGQSSNNPPAAAIDNISIVVDPCPRPISVTAGNLTTTTAEISWTHPGATSYIVSYREVNDTAYTHMSATASPLTISGLTTATSYYAYVRSVCGSDTSLASVIIAFTTPCFDGPISTYPWTEGFENGLSCWSLASSGTAANYYWRIMTSGSYPTCSPHGGTNMVQYNSYSVSSGGWTTMASPSLDFSTDMQVSFWMYRDPGYSSYSNEGVAVYVSSTQDTVGATLLGFTPRYKATSGWDSISYLVPTGTLGTKYLILKATSEWGNNIYVDDVTVTTLGVPCTPPTNLTSGSITNTTATVSWIPAGTESSWQVRLGTTGTPENVSSTTYTFPSTLTPGTAYTYYVRANCGTNYSAWVQGTFTTTQGHQPVQVTTIPPTSISQTAATFQATYVQGTEALTAIGFEYKTTAATTWTDQAVTPVATPFTYQVTTLIANTNYEVRAYAVTPTDSRVYGATLSFATPAIVPPTVTTLTTTGITQTNATFNGTITQGSEEINARGFEYKLPSQAWPDANIISATGTNNITASVTNLQHSTTYEVRAYARTASMINYYGTTLTFTTQTPGVTPPVVVTNLANPVNDRSATLNGKVTPGSETITNQGFEWKATSSTTWTPVTVVAVNDTLTYQLTGIEPSTQYEFKAFATTASGTVYGTTQTFQTLGLNTIDGSVITVMMYPNPASQETKLVVTGLQGEVKITISDVQGRIINTINTKANNNKVEETINVSNMANGVYYVRLQNDQISRTQKLIVK
ncbi:hypothetical protein SDC9_12372 [bioreactor metagenome]|uniref:Fibronectin type III domain protein n=1 Tax=bioreactor metagenome TaxID=1076179 RepID=A0A644TI51_9ZZZZ